MLGSRTLRIISRDIKYHIRLLRLVSNDLLRAQVPPEAMYGAVFRRLAYSQAHLASYGLAETTVGIVGIFCILSYKNIGKSDKSDQTPRIWRPL
jgi:hypothetical protein